MRLCWDNDLMILSPINKGCYFLVAPGFCPILVAKKKPVSLIKSTSV